MNKLGLLLGISLISIFSTPIYALLLPNSTLPSQPGVLYYPELQDGYELNPMNRPPGTPRDIITTGNDQWNSHFDKSGYLDTTPVDDTGTEKDIMYQIQDPNWPVYIDH